MSFGQRQKKGAASPLPFFVSFDNLKLEAVAKADEKTVGLQSGVVARVEVKQAKTIAAKQVELVELHISAKHGVEIEAAHSAVVAIPVSGGSAAAKRVLGIASQGK